MPSLNSQTQHNRRDGDLVEPVTTLKLRIEANDMFAFNSHSFRVRHEKEANIIRNETLLKSINEDTANFELSYRGS